MKLKLKMDRKAIQEFFARHVEKIIFAAVVACFALIVYRAAARDMYPMTPDNQRATPDALAADVGKARARVEETDPKSHPEAYKTPDYLEIAGRSRIPIDVGPYICDKPISDMLFKPRRKRGWPPLLAVEGLRGTADYGKISMIDVENTGVALPDGGSGPRRLPNMQSTPVVKGQRWVVLTGLVPVQDQFQAMQDYFKTAQVRTPDDVPVYVGYQVQRTEVSATDAGQPVDWSKSETFYSGASISTAMASWGQSSYMAQELVEQKFVNKAVGFPLPPLVDRTWDESVVHEPEIRLVSRESQMYPPQGAAPTEDEAIDDPYRVRDPGSQYGVPGMQYGGPAAQYGVPGTRYDGAGPRYDGGRGEYDGRMMSGYAVPGAGRYGPGGYNQAATDYYLFRFFDFNVEPGKRYRYRVRLVLMNPNRAVEDRYLSEEVLTKKRPIVERSEKKAEDNAAEAAAIMREWFIVESDDWSEPSDVISVPRDSRLLVVSVQPPPRPAADPTGKVMLISWVQNLGIEAYKELGVGRGKVANFSGRFPENTAQPRAKKAARRPSGEYDGAYDGGYQPPERMAVDALVQEAPLVDYLTDTLVLDLNGGERIPGNDGLKRPGAMLLLDPDGNLVVRHELDDLAEYAEFRERPLPGQQPGGGYGPGREYDGYGPGTEYDGYGPGYGGNLGGLRGGGASYDGPANKRPSRPPRSRSGRGGS